MVLRGLAWVFCFGFLFVLGVGLVGLFPGAFLDKVKHLFPDAEYFFWRSKVWVLMISQEKSSLRIVLDSGKSDVYPLRGFALRNATEIF